MSYQLKDHKTTEQKREIHYLDQIEETEQILKEKVSRIHLMQSELEKKYSKPSDYQVQADIITLYELFNSAILQSLGIAEIYKEIFNLKKEQNKND